MSSGAPLVKTDPSLRPIRSDLPNRFRRNACVLRVIATQLIGAFKKMVSEGETTEKFEKKIVTPIKAATARMKHAKKIMPEITPILTKFHEKVPSQPSACGNG